MKADKPLEWRRNVNFPNQWQASTEFHSFFDSYIIAPSRSGNDWFVEGFDDRPETLEAAQQLCQDHYNQKRRLKAWEEYMLSHEPPEEPGTSPFQSQYEWEAEFARNQPDGVTCQVEDCTGHTNWGWCSVHTPLHYGDLP